MIPVLDCIGRQQSEYLFLSQISGYSLVWNSSLEIGMVATNLYQMY